MSYNRTRSLLDTTRTELARTKLVAQEFMKAADVADQRVASELIAGLNNGLQPMMDITLSHSERLGKIEETVETTNKVVTELVNEIKKLSKSGQGGSAKFPTQFTRQEMEKM